jgi:hypothetical protein
MKVTIDIPDALLREARKFAAREGTTLSALIERALLRVVAQPKPSKKPFKMRDGSVGGNGLRPELRDAPWSVIRALAYTDSGD